MKRLFKLMRALFFQDCCLIPARILEDLVAGPLVLNLLDPLPQQRIFELSLV